MRVGGPSFKTCCQTLVVGRQVVFAVPTLSLCCMHIFSIQKNRGMCVCVDNANVSERGGVCPLVGGVDGEGESKRVAY